MNDLVTLHTFTWSIELYELTKNQPLHLQQAQDTQHYKSIDEFKFRIILFQIPITQVVDVALTEHE